MTNLKGPWVPFWMRAPMADNKEGRGVSVKTHRTEYRVIYGDTDNMGVAYHANYLRWFEIGRAELFRSLGMTYKSIEEKG